MNEAQMLEKLVGVPEGARVFVSYEAGNEPTERAIREAERSRQEGYPSRYFTGTLAGVRMTRDGSWMMTVLCDTRDDERTGQNQAFRSFNPSVGRLICVEVLDT